MYGLKQLLGGRLSLRNYITQVYAMLKAMNKLTGMVCLKFSELYKN
ncbi:hypothetical protein VCHE48_1273 [Vibrio cholerae HE48]|nr:hypothetical protein VCHE48_1273 [Vibrio cholerae HE48]GIB61462.1 transposase DDE domain protein [Vibrio cholerae]